MTASYFMICATDKPGSAALRDATRERHRAYLRAPNPHGVETVLGGPLVDDDGRMNGSLLVVRAATRAQAESFLAGDPYRVAGLFERVEVRAWDWSLGRPAEPADPADPAPAAAR